MSKFIVTEGPVRVGPGRKLRMLGDKSQARDLHKRLTGSGAAVDLGGEYLDLQLSRSVDLKTGAHIMFIDDGDAPKYLLAATEPDKSRKAHPKRAKPSVKKSSAPPKQPPGADDQGKGEDQGGDETDTGDGADGGEPSEEDGDGKS